MSENQSIVVSVYAAFNTGDIEGALALLDPDVVWHERDSVEGFVVGGTHHGPQGVLAGVFAQVPAHFDEFRVETDRYHDAGDTIVAEARYVGTARGGEPLDVAVTHIWTLAAGKVVRHAAYPDTAMFVAVLDSVPA